MNVDVDLVQSDMDDCLARELVAVAIESRPDVLDHVLTDLQRRAVLARYGPAAADEVRFLHVALACQVSPAAALVAVRTGMATLHEAVLDGR